MLYEALDALRKLRNKVHILADQKEEDMFEKIKLEKIEYYVEIVLKLMLKNYNRDSNWVESLKLPWASHLQD